MLVGAQYLYVMLAVDPSLFCMLVFTMSKESHELNRLSTVSVNFQFFKYNWVLLPTNDHSAPLNPAGLAFWLTR